MRVSLLQVCVGAGPYTCTVGPNTEYVRMEV